MKRCFLLFSITIIAFTACTERKSTLVSTESEKDSILTNIESKVREIILSQDSLVMVPSLRFAKDVDETYTAKMYGKNQITKWIREEKISNVEILGRDYYYNNGHLIFIKEEGSAFKDSNEVYTEKLIFVNDDVAYKAFEKHQYTEDDMFSDSLFKQIDFDLTSIDIQKPYRALQQQGEFAMQFDQFLLIDPQSYLIVENSDKSMNAALYIIEGDSLLNVLYENPAKYKGQKLWVYHSFREMNGIERMIYEGAVLLKEQVN